ncbi:MAG: tetratricopeptide repeat protein [Candidatus Poribacteria bacterium]|nr:tetratricopeptide repeat protein [Candidatus Poribacteria bacterium]
MNSNTDQILQKIGEKALKDSVVQVSWHNPDKKSSEKDNKYHGTGFFVKRDLVVTNLHCVAGASSIIAILPSRNAEFPVEGVVATDIENDLVILKIGGRGKPLPIADSDTVQIDEVVTAVGYSGKEKNDITNVKIQDIRDSIRKFKTKESFKRGHSGSPLLNSSGEVIGIAVAVFANVLFFMGASTISQGFAIPANILSDLLKNIENMVPLEEWQEQPQIQAYTQGVQGQQKLAQGKHTEAQRCFDEAIELNPDMYDVYINRSIIHISLDEPEQAINDCNTAIRLNPNLIEAYINKGAANLFLNKYEETIADCNHILKHNPKMLQAYILRATARTHIDDNKEAENDYDKAIQINPDAMEIYLSRANVRYEQEDYAGAIEDFDKLINDASELSSLFNVRASRSNAKYKLGDYEGAIEDIETVLESNPNDMNAYVSRAYAKYQIGLSTANSGDKAGSRKYYKETIEDLNVVLGTKTKDHYAYKTRAHAKHRLGSINADLGNKASSRAFYRDAIEDYNAAVATGPKCVESHYYRALTNRYLKQYQDAIIDFDKVTELNAKHFNGYFQRGLVKRYFGKIKIDKGDVNSAINLYQQAIDDYTEGIKLKPKHHTSFNNRAFAKYYLGNTQKEQGNMTDVKKHYQSAIEDYNEAIRLHPKYSLSLENRALIHYLLGQIELDQHNIANANEHFQASVADCDEYIRINPKKLDTTVYLRRGDAQAAQGNYDNAIKDYNEVIRLKPKYASAYYGRGIAYQNIGMHDESTADIIKAKELNPNIENKTD